MIDAVLSMSIGRLSDVKIADWGGFTMNGEDYSVKVELPQLIIDEFVTFINLSFSSLYKNF